MDLSIKHFTNFNYEESLTIIESAYEIYKKSIKQDAFFEVEYLLNKAIFLSAIGKIEETMTALDKAIEVSNETNVYYKSDELYRLRANIFLMSDKYDDFSYCLKKAKQFAEFTENNLSLGLIEYSLSIYENDNNNPTTALVHIQNARQLLSRAFYLESIEEARAYYLLENYNRAYASIKNIDFSNERAYHTMDFLLLWRGKIYEGLILNKLGETKKGMESIKCGLDKMKTMPISKFLAFGYRSLSEIHSEEKNYEEAFSTLKKANEIEDKLKGMAY